MPTAVSGRSQLCVKAVSRRASKGPRGPPYGFKSAALGEAIDQAEHKSSTQAPQPALAQKIYIRGELNTSMVLDALK